MDSVFGPEMDLWLAVVIGLAIGLALLGVGILIMRQVRGGGGGERSPRRERSDRKRAAPTGDERVSRTVTAEDMPEATFELSDFAISPVEAREGQTISIAFKVTNTGNVRGVYPATLKIGGWDRGKLNINLGAGESEVATFAVTENTPGEYLVEVDGLEGMFYVSPARMSVAALNVDPVRPREKGQVTVTAELSNSGGVTGAERLEVRLRDEVLVYEDLTVGPGGNQKVDITLTNLQPGAHEVRIGDVSKVFLVEMADYIESL